MFHLAVRALLLDERNEQLKQWPNKRGRASQQNNQPQFLVGQQNFALLFQFVRFEFGIWIQNPSSDSNSNPNINRRRVSAFEGLNLEEARER